MDNIDSASVPLTPETKPDDSIAGTPEKLTAQVNTKTASVDSGLGLDNTMAVCSKDATPDASVFVTFAANKYTIPVNLNQRVEVFKEKILELTGVPLDMQKLIFKGVKLVDGKTLKECSIEDNGKIMLIGSKPNEVADIKTPSTANIVSDIVETAAKKEPLCRQKQHMKILEKGIPDDALPGIKNARDPLPDYPISGMVNKIGGKVRFTFKLELDQVWIGTKERTEKINMSQIKKIVNEPIEFHEEYHILGLQMGPTEQSLYFLYWVPAQYIHAIKDAIMGG